jgi:pimeloyl-ACP methyl ester carboxylesterase
MHGVDQCQMSHTEVRHRPYAAAVEYEQQAQKLSLGPSHLQDGDGAGRAVEARFITPLDPVIETADGNRLPAVPVQEAHKINLLKSRLENRPYRPGRPRGLSRFDRQNRDVGEVDADQPAKDDHESESSRLDEAIPVFHTHPLFPPLPLYGPPSLLRDVQCAFFRTTSAILSTAFLAVVVLGAVFTSIPHFFKHTWLWLTFRDSDMRRPFYEEEQERARIRLGREKEWRKRRKANGNAQQDAASSSRDTSSGVYEPFEGGPDKLVCDIRYYARRVGLDAEQFKVQTEDGFIVDLWHIYNPKEYQPAPESRRQADAPAVFSPSELAEPRHVHKQYKNGDRRYPVLLIHGLLQSAGAYCSNDDDSLAFYLCKSGYDVWLGNNRCGFEPQHSLLEYQDPRMWAWNIRQMGVMDLPAFLSKILQETGFEKLALVCHSQGTTQTFVALAKEQRPDLGDKISVFCALAPAVYAGPLIGKMYFKFMRVISPAGFRMFFGVHSFIPLMMTMHKYLPGKIYGAMGYRVFSFLFDWTDTRWDRGLRDRLFQFSPVYVSSESMRWWLGRECFAKQKCILATREVGEDEDVEDEEDEERRESAMANRSDRGKTAWYNEHVPPMALWVAGSDRLVDGKRLLRRFERGREPHAQVVHSKVIEEYEHLDVIWAIDSIEQVGKEVRQVIWDTIPAGAKDVSRRITGIDVEGGPEAGINADQHR